MVAIFFFSGLSADKMAGFLDETRCFPVPLSFPGTTKNHFFFQTFLGPPHGQVFGVFFYFFGMFSSHEDCLFVGENTGPFPSSFPDLSFLWEEEGRTVLSWGFGSEGCGCRFALSYPFGGRRKS